MNIYHLTNYSWFIIIIHISKLLRAMKKSSNLCGYFRELMAGVNQCRRNGEWTLEPPNRTPIGK